MIKVSDDALRRAFPHRIPDSARFGWCPACAGGGETSDPQYRGDIIREIPELGTRVGICLACDGTGERTVNRRGA